MDSLFIDIDYAQEKKEKQNTCGDSFLSKRYPNEGRLIAVLSDGLGSGIKANILSSMTATMILKFIAAGRDLLKASEVVMDSLPVCQVRKISYATFSVVDCYDNGLARIAEEGNPQFLFFRQGEFIDFEPKIITSKKFSSRHLHIYEIKLKPEDRLVFCSDGVTQAGLGGERHKLGWRREGLKDYIIEKLSRQGDLSSRQLAQDIVREAAKKEVNKQPKDDVSCAVLYFRTPRKLMVFTGPPYYADRDNEYANILDEFKGKKIVCGGTTANLISRELNRPILNKTLQSGGLPSCSSMEGIDLITEGILTLTQAVEYLENDIITAKDSAGKLINMLLDSDCIDFMVGSRLNPAHSDPDLPVELEIRKTVIKRMVKLLQEKYIKKVSLKFI